MQTYFKVASVLERIETGHMDFKGAVFKWKESPNFKEIYALSSSILTQKALLNDIEAYTKNIVKGKQVQNKYLFRVILYEHLFSIKKLKFGGKLARLVKDIKASIIEKFGDQIEIKKESKKENLFRKNVYVRYLPSKDVDKDKESVSQLSEFKKDSIIDNLYCLSYQQYSEFNTNKFPLYHHPDFVIQSKSSCLPLRALQTVLDSEFNGCVVETCSAPGNKTLQLLEYFPMSSVHSFELDKKRFKLLEKRLGIYKKPYFADCQTYQRDFFELSLTDIDPASVEVVVADPSCSGSGMLNRFNDLDIPETTDFESFVNEKRKGLNKKEQTKVDQLTSFQYKLLDYCFSNFTNLKYLVYSTCSIYNEENEDMVKKMLKKHEAVELVDIKLDGWEQRGFGECEGKYNPQYCLRENPLQRKNDGFFVALFKVNNSNKQV